MEISKMLNPAPSNSEDRSKQQRKKLNQPTPTSTEAASQKDCEAEQRGKRGMPKEGLNTFRVKSQ
ncbi:Protein of unknown function [Pyronema omphalodes CBS 100304]|uniref:Uncharacterized protein n=1 Tax=Pyronema omphalodes (strain CBS 100304) TaxID=1076935 RepID=U4KUZ3_PYROM|nr:Protein of unknown function [Pyronema omphalodes CBS 100304]